MPLLLKWKDPGLNFDVALHAGTLLAVLAYFWRYWVEMMQSSGSGRGRGSAPRRRRSRPFRPRGPAGKSPAALVYGGGHDPGALAGWRFERARGGAITVADNRRRRLNCGGAFHGAGDWLGKRERDLGHVGFLDSFLVGVAQALAVIPGVSRSGVTMTAGLFRRMKRETAARFSFLLSTPLIAGAALKKGMEIRHEGLPHDMRLPFLRGISSRPLSVTW